MLILAWPKLSRLCRTLCTLALCISAAREKKKKAFSCGPVGHCGSIGQSWRGAQVFADARLFVQCSDTRVDDRTACGGSGVPGPCGSGAGQCYSVILTRSFSESNLV